MHAGASASLTATELAGPSEAQHPGAAVSVNFAGSSAPVQQLSEGAFAAVLATADERSRAVDADLVDDTDVRSARDAVEVVEAPQASQAIDRYPTAALADSDETESGRQFTEPVAGDREREVLAGAGSGAL